MKNNHLFSFVSISPPEEFYPESVEGFGKELTNSDYQLTILQQLANNIQDIPLDDLKNISVHHIGSDITLDRYLDTNKYPNLSAEISKAYQLYSKGLLAAPLAKALRAAMVFQNDLGLSFKNQIRFIKGDFEKKKSHNVKSKKNTKIQERNERIKKIEERLSKIKRDKEIVDNLYPAVNSFKSDLIKNGIVQINENKSNNLFTTWIKRVLRVPQKRLELKTVDATEHIYKSLLSGSVNSENSKRPIYRAMTMVYGENKIVEFENTTTIGDRIAVDERSFHGYNPKKLSPERLKDRIEEEECNLISQTNKLFYEELINERVFSEESFDRSRLDLIPPSQNEAVHIAGVGDLITVEERLLRYIPADISHITNVTGGIQRIREHSHKVLIESVEELIQFSESETLKAFETNTRTELKSTATQTANEVFKIDGGLKLSGSYGTVSFETTLSAGYQSNRSESNSLARSKSIDVTNKTEEKLREYNNQLSRTTQTTETTEKNTETIDSTEDKALFFVWLEQLREVRMVNKGQRLFVEFYVPEPGVDLRTPISNLSRIKAPPKFNLNPTSISEQNYIAYSSYYGVTELISPPAEYVSTKIEIITNPGSKNKFEVDVKEKIVPIPNGYIPIKFRYTADDAGNYDHWNTSWYIALNGQQIYNDWSNADPSGSDNNSQIEILFFDTLLDIPNEIDLTTRLRTTAGTTLSLVVWNHFRKGASLNGVIICKRTCEAFSEWQYKVFNACREANLSQIQEYEDKVEMYGGNRPFLGASPSENRRRERTEIKKWCKQILTVPKIETNPFFIEANYSTIEPITTSQRAVIDNLINNCFEWDEMIVFLDDYESGPTYRHKELLASQSSDPEHTLFLQASGSRVIVPISPRFETLAIRLVNSESVLNLELIEEFNRQISHETIEESDLPSGIGTNNLNLYLEQLVKNKPGVVFGSGRIRFNNGSDRVELINSRWELNQIDIGRTIYFANQEFVVTGFEDSYIILDKEWEGENTTDYYAIDEVQLGKTWNIQLPTPLILLANNETLPILDEINSRIENNFS